MQVVEAQQRDIESWAALRNCLWPGEIQMHLDEARQLLSQKDEIAFLLRDKGGALHGFVEGKYYHSGNKPYGHIEGWYVLPGERSKGYGRLLLERLESWFLHHAITHYHSDTIETDYPLSKKAHEANGYKVLYKITVFGKASSPDQ
jgi:GNAT superfamily N-acetyltransferase